jgi:hypothetical protein
MIMNESFLKYNSLLSAYEVKGSDGDFLPTTADHLRFGKITKKRSVMAFLRLIQIMLLAR